MNIVLNQTPVNLFTAASIEPGTELIVQNIGQADVSFSVETAGATKDYVAKPGQLTQVAAGATVVFASAYLMTVQSEAIISVRSRAEFDLLRPFTGVDVGPAGPAGNDGAVGPAGDGSTFSKVASQIISIGQVLRADGAANCGRASSATVGHAGLVIGIATNDAAVSENVSVRAAGYMTKTGGTWTPNQQVFVGVDGALTQVAPTAGFCQTVALAVSADTILIRLNSPILL